jgi:hypothetical protein
MARLRLHLTAVEVGDHVGAAAGSTDVRPARTASWLVHVASLLLPPGGGRERYGEEFMGELRDLVELGAGPRAQLGYALRQVVRVWALRRALPVAPSHGSAEPHRVRVRVTIASVEQQWRQPWNVARAAVGRWLDRREARAIIRQQVRAQRRQERARRAPGTVAGRHRMSRWF